MRRGDWIMTYTGRQYWPMDPRPDEVDLLDVAHALSNLCRYTGHCQRFYSVAEHSVLVSRLVRPEHALAGLMHDAPEAYVNDLARPLKRFLPQYQHVEELNWRAVAKKFGLPERLPDDVHRADNMALRLEYAELMTYMPAHMPPVSKTDCAGLKIIGLSPYFARDLFMARYAEIIAGGCITCD